MKRFRLLALCFLVVIVATLVCSCGSKNELDTPSGVYVEYDTLTLRWKEVQGAKVYTVRISSDENKYSEARVSKNSYSLMGLDPGRYSITVMADESGDAAGSSLSPSVEFIRDKENGLAYTLINGGSSYEVSGIGSASGVIEIPDTYRQKPVTSIGAEAFFGEGSVTEVKIPDSVKSIGDFAFTNCSYLKKANIPSKLTYIGESAFSGCRGLESKIEIPSSLSTVSTGAFAYCSSVEELIINEGVVSIEKNAFTDCSDIKALALPSTLKNLGAFAFAACSSISEVTFGEGIESIGEFAFSKAVSLNSVSLPDSLKKIGAGAFYNCSSLADVELGNCVEEIDHSAFLDTYLYKNSVTNEIYVGKWFIALKDNTVFDITFKPDTLGIANNAFYGNKSIDAIVLPDSIERIGKLAFAESDILSIETGSGLKYIDDQAFLSCRQLRGVYLSRVDRVNESNTVPCPLETIGNYAFMNCLSLERIDLPDTVRDIGAYAFRYTAIYNNALTGVVYADNWLVDFNERIQPEISVDLKTVGIARYAFYNCTAITKVTVNSEVKTIGKGAFYNCVYLESVILPSSLERIEDYTFYSCIRLRISNLPSKLKEIGRSAFYGCGIVKDYKSDTDSDELRIPSGVTRIEDYAFFGCGYRSAEGMDGATETGGIDVIIMGDSIESIGKCAFYGFASLKKVLIGSAVVIGEKAFYGCPSLEEVAVSSGITSIGDKAFYGCDSLKAVAFADTLKKVGNYSFYGCSALERADIGNGVEKIGKFAFFGNKSLELFYLPQSVSSIGDQAFRDCDSLESVIIGNAVEYIGDNAFYSCNKLTIYSTLDGAPSTFSKRWNSSFCPVVWCAVMSDEENYIISITVKDGSVGNAFKDAVLSDPIREGYVFAGWNQNVLSNEGRYSSSELIGIKNEMKLYSVWHLEDKSEE